MSNTILTHQMIAREAAAMLVEEDNLIPNINTGYDGEFGKPVQGYQKGQTIAIGVPPVPVTWNGSTFVDNDVKESSVNLTLSQQIGAGLKFGAIEKTLSISDFKNRFLRPTINSVRTQVQAYIASIMGAGAGGFAGTSGTVPADRVPWAKAAAVLDRALAPPDDRTVLMSSDSNANLLNANAALFNPDASISKQYKSGYVKQYAGFDFHVNQLLPVQAGCADAAYQVNAAGQTGSSLVIKTGAAAIPAGTAFTIGGVFAVHPITGATTKQLRVFRTTAVYAGGAGTISIAPAIVPVTSSFIGNVSAAPAANAPITFLDTQATAVTQNLAFHKNAVAAAFAPLAVMASCEGYTATAGNVSVRVMTFGDGFNDLERTRVDVLCGAVLVRPDHVCRVTE